MFKNMKIGKKLVLGFVIVTILASVSGVMSIFMMRDITGKYGDALENYGFSQGDIGKAMAAFCRVDGNVHDSVGFVNEEIRTSANNDYFDQAAKMDDYFEVRKRHLRQRKKKHLQRKRQMHGKVTVQPQKKL